MYNAHTVDVSAAMPLKSWWSKRLCRSK